MKMKPDWTSFNTAEELQALADYVMLTWDGLSRNEATDLVHGAFVLGWNTAENQAQRATLDGKIFLAGEQYNKRFATMLSLEYTPLQVLDDNVLFLYRLFSRPDELLTEPPGFHANVKPLHKALVKRLGAHIQDARPKGWTSTSSDDAYMSTQSNQDAFKGTCSDGNSGVPLLECISAQYLKAGVNRHEDDAVGVLVGAVYAHAFKLREMYNREALGQALASIDSAQPHVPPGEPVHVQESPIMKSLLQSNAVSNPDMAKALACIVWKPATQGLASSPALNM